MLSFTCFFLEFSGTFYLNELRSLVLFLSFFFVLYVSQYVKDRLSFFRSAYRIPEKRVQRYAYTQYNPNISMPFFVFFHPFLLLGLISTLNRAKKLTVFRSSLKQRTHIRLDHKFDVLILNADILFAIIYEPIFKKKIALNIFF